MYAVPFLPKELITSVFSILPDVSQYITVTPAISGRSNSRLKLQQPSPITSVSVVENSTNKVLYSEKKETWHHITLCDVKKEDILGMMMDQLESPNFRYTLFEEYVFQMNCQIIDATFIFVDEDNEEIFALLIDPHSLKIIINEMSIDNMSRVVSHDAVKQLHSLCNKHGQSLNVSVTTFER